MEINLPDFSIGLFDLTEDAWVGPELWTPVLSSLPLKSGDTGYLLIAFHSNLIHVSVCIS